MTLQEKAIKEYGDDIHLWAMQRDGFKVGYTQCKSDLLDFIKANPKTSATQITDYLNSL